MANSLIAGEHGLGFEVRFKGAFGILHGAYLIRLQIPAKVCTHLYGRIESYKLTLRRRTAFSSFRQGHDNKYLGTGSGAIGDAHEKAEPICFYLVHANDPLPSAKHRLLAAAQNEIYSLVSGPKHLLRPQSQAL